MTIELEEDEDVLMLEAPIPRNPDLRPLQPDEIIRSGDVILYQNPEGEGAFPALDASGFYAIQFIRQRYYNEKSAHIRRNWLAYIGWPCRRIHRQSSFATPLPLP